MSNLVATKDGSVAKANSNSLTFPQWSSWIDDMFNVELPSIISSKFDSRLTLPKVNIRETDDSYLVDMAVPGMKKSDFKIELDKHMLSISTELEEEKETSEKNHLRREFGYESFMRSFSLPESVEEDKIKATYKDGILNILIPKREDAIKQPPRRIEIS